MDRMGIWVKGLLLVFILIHSHALVIAAEPAQNPIESEEFFWSQGELSGNITPQLRYFFKDPETGPAYSANLSLSLEPEYYLEWAQGKQALTFVPFGRLDQRDSRRTHADIRELNWLYVTGDWEWRVGVGKVFWGVTEFVHLVDIINQTDAIEDIDDEDRLGQPMIKLTWLWDWGALQAFVLPYFRERTFTGNEGRIRTQLVVDTGQTQYESGAGQHHLDGALRLTGTVGLLDYSLSQFVGTARDPELLLSTDNKGRPVLAPRYNQIAQTSLELQAVVGDWLWKLEALYQDNPVKDFSAAVGGFEYTFVGVFETPIDVGLVSEYSYDDREENAPVPFQNDLFIGARVTLNDAQSTDLLAGTAYDLSNHSKSLRLEANRRIGDRWKLTAALQIFSGIDEKDALFSFRDQDFLQVDFGYFF